MATKDNKVSSQRPSRHRLALAVCILVGVVASAVWGAVWGANWRAGNAHAAADGAMDQAANELRGDAAWDARPLRVDDDLTLSEIQYLPPIQQITAVDALPPGSALSPRQVAGLKALVAAPTALDVVRNNAANRLIQRGDDPQLWRFFAELHRNPDESAVWRDYSLQFWAMSIPFAGDEVSAAAAELAVVAEEAGQAFAGTALLHLARLHDEGLAIDQGLIQGVISKRLGADATPDALRHTCLALIGEGGYRDLLPLARAALNDGSGVEALRGALFTLGRLGDASDRARVAPYLEHAHPGVVLAARAAADRLAAAPASQTDSPAGDAS